ncbi:hypothetical protein J6590_047020 [Homalodisca vitripennis]|nr:hypothetical protein J6590_047020 [Homalodisca vitripennis]
MGSVLSLDDMALHSSICLLPTTPLFVEHKDHTTENWKDYITFTYAVSIIRRQRSRSGIPQGSVLVPVLFPPWAHHLISPDP